MADLLVALLVMPLAAVELTTGVWIYGELFCLVRTSLDVLLTTASILHLCCIALDRYGWIIENRIRENRMSISQLCLSTCLSIYLRSFY